jgi:hypothetical protein
VRIESEQEFVRLLEKYPKLYACAPKKIPGQGSPFPATFEISGKYLDDPPKLQDPANWMARLIFPQGTVLKHLAAPRRGDMPIHPRDWVPKFLPTLEQFYRSQRQVSEVATVEISPSGGTSIVLGPDTPHASSMVVGVDVLLNDTVTVCSDRGIQPGTFYNGKPLNAFGDSNLTAPLAGPLNLAGPANEGPSEFSFAVLLYDLGPTGHGNNPLKFPITVTISGTIEQVTAKDLIELPI